MSINLIFGLYLAGCVIVALAFAVMLAFLYMQPYPEARAVFYWFRGFSWEYVIFWPWRCVIFPLWKRREICSVQLQDH